ncbi:MAG: SH3 domain-containing protein [Leptolyngbyaceae cyanobacterium bins.349]|nr:SH3 domain-containing protein [Leptolyngbyaceae cyanobacterium bins.349]
MEQIWQAALWLSASFSFPFAIASLTDRVLSSTLDSHWMATQSTLETSTPRCQTLIADPNPPLNVRSSPIVALDNRLASLPNGTTLAVVDEQDGWLRINSPIQGWVYKELTVTTCANAAKTATVNHPIPINLPPQNQDYQLIAIATEQYHSGNLKGAIALTKTVSPQTAAYPNAQRLAYQWQLDWNRAESDYYVAQKALRDGRWQDVLNQVNGYPDIRYWREKLALLVQQATTQRQTSTP